MHPAAAPQPNVPRRTRQLATVQALPFGALPIGRVHVGPDVSGKYLVTRAQLRKRLGYAAYHVWEILLECRSEDGTTVATRERLREYPGYAAMAPRMVKKGLQRLTEAGLLKTLKIDRRRFFERGRWHFTEQRIRFVAGCKVVRAADACDSALVPANVWQWMNRPDGRGGKRAGAGRPAKSKEGPPTEIKRGSADLLFTVPVDGSSFGRTPLAAVASSDSTSKAPSPVSSERSPSPVQSESAVGIRFGGGGGRRGPPPPPGQRGVPPYPGPTVLAAAVIPPPPQLPQIEMRETVAFMARAYRGAISARYGTTPWQVRGDLTHTKHYDKLRKAAELLRQEEIAPAAWCAWSIDVWRQNNPKGEKKMPPLQWVYGLGRIEERARWFRSEMGSYGGGRVVFGKSAKDLLTRYSAMQMELVRAQAVSQDEVLTIVQRHFPGDLYDALLRAARAEASAEQNRMQLAARRGDWLW